MHLLERYSQDIGACKHSLTNRKSFPHIFLGGMVVLSSNISRYSYIFWKVIQISKRFKIGSNLTYCFLLQVFKLSPDMKVLMSLGKRFVKGNDSHHFCKPADVAVMTDGSFFVADGWVVNRSHSPKKHLPVQSNNRNTRKRFEICSN